MPKALKKKFKNLYSKNIFFYILLILLFVFTFSIGDYYTYISNLSGQYLLRSLNFFTDFEIMTYSRGPIYPLIISVFYELFGFGFEKAVYVNYLFYCLSIIIIYLISKTLYNAEVGFLASLITLLSVSLLNVALTVELSFIFTFFILLSLYFLILAEDYKKNIFSIISGVSIGLACLTKEIAIFYLFCPFFSLIFKNYRNKFFIKGYILYFSFFILTLIPWIILGYLNNSLHELLGEFKRGQGANIEFYGETNYFSFLFKSFTTGLYESLRFLKNSGEFAIFYIFSGVYIFINIFFIKKNYKRIHFYLYLLIAFLFLAPFGLFLDGTRQITINIILLNIGVSYFVIQIFKTLKIKLNDQSYGTIFILIIFFYLSIHVIKNRFNYFNDIGFHIKPTGRMNKDLIDLSDYIKKNPSNKNLCFNMKSDHSLMYLTELKNNYIRPKLTFYLNFQDFSKKYFFDKKDEIILIKYHPKFNLNQNRYFNLEILYKENLKNFFKKVEKSNCLLIISHDSLFLETFLKSEWIVFSNQYKVYFINDFSYIYSYINNFDSKSAINSFLQSDYVKYLEIHHKDRYNLLKEMQ